MLVDFGVVVLCLCIRGVVCNFASEGANEVSDICAGDNPSSVYFVFGITAHFTDGGMAQK